MKKKHIVWVAVALLFLGINILFFYQGQEKMVEYVGLNNTYLITFLVGLITGLSSLTGVAFPTAVSNFSAGGAGVLPLALFGGLGVFISDSIFYYFLYYGRNFAPDNLSPFMKRVEDFIRKYNKKLVLLFVFFYLVFSPLPNDLMMIVLVVAGYKYKEIFIPLLLGSFGYACFYAVLGKVFL